MTTFNNFVATIKTSGIAFQNHYFVNIMPPRFMARTANQEMLTQIPFYVDAINLPEQQLATRPVNDTGITREVAYEPLFGTVTASFFADRSLIIKSFFDDWVGAISLTRTGRLMYPDQYKVDDLAIYVVNKAKQVTYIVLLKNAYPKIVDDAQLASDGKGPITFRVQFVYETWESYSINHDAPQQIFADPGTTDGLFSTVRSADNSLTNLRNAWNLVQLIRTGANKDAVKSLIINTGTRKVLDVLNSTGAAERLGKTIDGALSGVGSVIGGLKGVVL